MEAIEVKTAAEGWYVNWSFFTQIDCDLMKLTNLVIVQTLLK